MNPVPLPPLLILALSWSSTISLPVLQTPQLPGLLANSKPTTCTVQWISSTSLKVEWCGVDEDNIRKPFDVEVKCTKGGNSCSTRFKGDGGQCDYTAINLCEGKCTFKMTLPDTYSCVGITEIGTPSAPVNLKTTSVTGTSIEIEWGPPVTANGPIHGYQVTIKSTTPGVNDQVKTTTEKKFQLQNLVPATSYKFTVEAFNNDPKVLQKKLLGPPADITVSTTVTAPSAPVDLKTTSITGTSIHIKWDPPGTPNGPIDGYQVTIKSTIPGEADQVKTTKENKFQLQNLVPATSYKITVEAFNNEPKNLQKKLLGPPADITVSTTVTAPSAPVNLKTTSITGTSIEIEWGPPVTANGPIDGYQVTIKSTTPGVNDEVKTTKEKKLQLQNLVPATSYKITVEAFNNDPKDSQKQLLGPPADITVSTTVTAPSAPVNLRTTSITATSIEIEWDSPVTANGPIDGYIVTVKSTTPAVNDQVKTTKENKLQLQKLVPATSCKITVEAFNDDPKDSQQKLLGPPADITVSTTVSGSKTVSGLRVVNVDSTQASFKWETDVPLVIPPLYYINLYKSDWKKRECITSLEHVDTYETNCTELELKNLLPYSCYHLGVTAPTAEGTNRIALLISFKTKIGSPTAPRNLQTTQITDTSIEVEWTEPREANGHLDGYIIEYETHGQYKGSFRGETVHCRFRAEGLRPWTNYTFTVRAFNVDNEDGNARIVGESSELSLQTQISVPSTPRNLTLLHLNSTYVSLSWLPPKPVVGETWYKIMLFKTNKEQGQCNSALENVAMHDTFETEKYYDDLVPNSCYYVIVTALTEKGSSTNSVVTTFVTQVYNGLPGPANVEEVISTQIPVLN